MLTILGVLGGRGVYARKGGASHREFSGKTSNLMLVISVMYLYQAGTSNHSWFVLFQGKCSTLTVTDRNAL